ncbi:hypothetical protein Ndes2526B_g01027 [Nannochloris sp. 'desiccata']|nr:hypothetical protein KSW81_002155 [Chlorella desiccata (nom. nud.)]KAH7623781.1 putative Subtilisin-like protease 2 [Chlorella desiccata (nom. nud.)]
MVAAGKILPLALLLLITLLPTAWTHPRNDRPNFHHQAQPTFTQGADAVHNRIVLKSKETDHFTTDSNSISKKLRLATMDFNPEEEEGDIHGKLKELMQKAEYAIKDSIVWANQAEPTAVPPNDPDYRYQWGLTKVKGPEAWQILADSQPASESRPTRSTPQVVTVCVADSGTDINHQDLVGRLDPKIGYNAIDKNNDVSDGLKHGTHVAGIVAAIENNSLDIAGVGTDRVQILTCKFLNAQGYGFASDAVACIDYCLENGADIITNSWSGGEDNPALRDAIQDTLDKDVLVVVAAGNTASNLDTEKAYPASYAAEFPNMLVVASTNYQDKLSNFSNYGAESVHLGAPGEWILSIVPDDQTDYYSGTSMAAPLVAGAAALVQSASGRKLSAKELRDIIIETVDPLPSLQENVISGGILRVDKAVQAALDQAPAPTSRKLLAVH